MVAVYTYTEHTEALYSCCVSAEMNETLNFAKKRLSGPTSERRARESDYAEERKRLRESERGYAA